MTEFKQGALYKVVDGVLTELESDENDQALRRIRVAESVLEEVRKVQKQMRKMLDGRKPDLALVAEALLCIAASRPGIEVEVCQYFREIFNVKEG